MEAGVEDHELVQDCGRAAALSGPTARCVLCFVDNFAVLATNRSVAANLATKIRDILIAKGM